MIYFNLPLYIDNVGTLLAGALGGVLPGMTVGFCTNVLGSISLPISLYYGVLSVIIGWLAASFSCKGMFKNIKGILLASGGFVLVGGAVGSLMTWFLYGGNIGGIAEPYALALYHQGMPAILSQFTVDILIDIPDKLITVFIVCGILKLHPHVLREHFPYSYLYDGTAECANLENAEQNHNYHHTIDQRILSVLMASITLISVMAVAIGSIYHHKRLIGSYENLANVVSQETADFVDGNRVDEFLLHGKAAEGYVDTENHLYQLLNNTSNISYLYVYSIKEDGCHVVFDLDTKAGKGDAPGTVLKDAQDFTDRLDLFLFGSEIETSYSSGSYGSFMTAYTQIKDDSGKTVAYACADVDMNDYVHDMLTYIIQVIAVLFAIALLIFTVALWFIHQHITQPIRMIVEQTKALDKISPENWLDSEMWKNRVPVQTEDELEELYETVCRAQENTSRNVKKVIETERKLIESQELERMNRELELAITKADEANQAKTDFLSRMSHDIRTPMNAILGTIALARDELDDPRAMEQSLDTIHASGQFLLGLINDILDINKIESGGIELRPEPYTVTEFVGTVNSTFRPLMEKKGLTFDFQINCGNHIVLVDKLRYNQVFFNLLSNAVKYTPRGGAVSFLVSNIEALEGEVGLRSVVRDNGIGMSGEYQSHLFEPFTRDTSADINQTEGSGLGLAIVKSIIDAMGGEIRVTSQRGEGTEFIVDLFLPISSKERESFVKDVDVNAQYRKSRYRQQWYRQQTYLLVHRWNQEFIKRTIFNLVRKMHL